MIVFSVGTETFLDIDNISLVVAQSLVVGTLALGQTLVILTAGIDLANAAIMVFGTLLMAKLAGDAILEWWRCCSACCCARSSASCRARW